MLLTGRFNSKRIETIGFSSTSRVSFWRRAATMAYHGRPHHIATDGDFIYVVLNSDGEQPPEAEPKLRNKRTQTNGVAS